MTKFAAAQNAFWRARGHRTAQIRSLARGPPPSTCLPSFLFQPGVSVVRADPCTSSSPGAKVSWRHSCHPSLLCPHRNRADRRGPCVLSPASRAAVLGFSVDRSSLAGRANCVSAPRLGLPIYRRGARVAPDTLKLSLQRTHQLDLVSRKSWRVARLRQRTCGSEFLDHRTGQVCKVPAGVPVEVVLMSAGDLLSLTLLQ